MLPEASGTVENRPTYALGDYLPPTGLSVALGLWPKALFADPDVGRALRDLLPRERLEAFRQVTGVELPLLEEAWVAEYELGRLYLVPFDHAEHAGSKFLEHSESRRTERRYAPDLRSYSALRAGVPHFVVVDQGRFTLVVEQEPTLGQLAVARALGKLASIEPALGRSGFEKLSPIASPLLALYWTGAPPNGEAESAPEGLGPSIVLGRLILLRSERAIDLRAEVLCASAEDPTPDWQTYLGALTERPEFRAVLGDSQKPTGATCHSVSPYFRCEATLGLDIPAVATRWGNLLLGRLDTF